MSSAFESWRIAFLDTVQQPAEVAYLKAASLAGDLKAWTACLTRAVVRSCETQGWRAAGKGHKLDLLPKAGQEYLGIDVMAFRGNQTGRWPFPLAAFELENSRKDDRVAYSFWKVLCLQVKLRVVFAYRPDWEQGRKLVHAVCEDVIGKLPAEVRFALKGDSVMVLGNRGENETFPWGYFKFWRLNTNLGSFERVD